MLGKNAARADATLALGGGEVRFRQPDVGPLQQQLGRHAGRHARNAQRVEAAALDPDLDRRPSDQHREDRDVLAQRLVEQRNVGAHRRHQTLLLRDVEL